MHKPTTMLHAVERMGLAPDNGCAEAPTTHLLHRLETVLGNLSAANASLFGTHAHLWGAFPEPHVGEDLGSARLLRLLDGLEREADVTRHLAGRFASELGA